MAEQAIFSRRMRSDPDRNFRSREIAPSERCRGPPGVVHFHILETAIFRLIERSNLHRCAIEFRPLDFSKDDVVQFSIAEIRIIEDGLMKNRIGKIDVAEVVSGKIDSPAHSLLEVDPERLLLWLRSK